MSDFYDDLAPFYHLIYPDWNASIDRQAACLDALIKGRCPDASAVLDVACGIGTQALGLAAMGYDVTASDLSPGAVERARVEAARRGLSIAFDVVDMRKAFDHFGRTFDIVIACDNAVAHLLTDDDLVSALSQMRASTRPGGACLVSCRDYAAEPKAGSQLKPYGVRVENGVRYVLWQVWDFTDGDCYNGDFYFVEDDGSEPRVTVMRSTYRAIGLDKLIAMMSVAGFVNICRYDDRFFQPIVVGTRP